MSKIKLKPCPFCGGETKLDEEDFYMFCCDECGVGITFAKELEDGTATDCSKDESIKKWNTRKPVENVVWQLEEMFKHHNATKTVKRLVIEIVKGGGVNED